MNDEENNPEYTPVLGSRKGKLTLTWQDLNLIINIKSNPFRNFI